MVLGRQAPAEKDAGLVASFKQGVWSFYSLRQDLSAASRAALALIPS